MADKILGEEDCLLEDIMQIMGRCETFTEIRTSWNALATQLKLTAKQIHDIQDACSERPKPEDVTQRILLEFKSKYDNKATLGVLLNALDNINLKAVANELRKKFGVPRESSETSMVVSETPSPIFTVLHFKFVESFLLIFKGQRAKEDELHATGRLRLISVIVVRPLTPMAFDDDYYCLPTKEKGLALVLNILQYRESKDNRYGGAADSYNMTQLLTQLGYQVDGHNDAEEDFTASRVDNIVANFKQECIRKQVKSFAVFLDGHGSKDRLYLSNGKLYDIYNKIIFKLCEVPEGVAGWATIPKIFFINACIHATYPQEGTLYKNCVIFQSCLPGTVSYRHPSKGSYFVMALTMVIMNEAHRSDLETMMEKVKNKVCDGGIGKGKLQQPTVWKLGSFGKLYFNLDHMQREE